VSLRAWVIQAFLLEAAARDRLGEPDAAERAAERALALAQDDGMLVPFLLHPAPGLLERHARHCRSHAGLISQILNLRADQKPTSPPGEPEFLPEPPGNEGGGGGAQAMCGGLPEALSDSETRVLRYLPTNLTAPEIAGQLYLSVHTVKTHMRHVYNKLGAHGRGEAVETARAHGLLPAPSWRP
jgi:LuxR family transcriptional regulator, maltose regulon positive regulatory protein